MRRPLDLIFDQWTEFASAPDVRVLRWVVTGEEAGIVDAFWGKESDPIAAETPDLLLRLSTPFEDVKHHGVALRRDFLGELQKAEEALGEQAPWLRFSCAEPRKGTSDVDALVGALEAFRAARVPEGEGVTAVLGVWLDARQVADTEKYVLWLARLCKAATGTGCRFVLLDDARRPVFESLSREAPTQVKSIVAELDVPEAVQEASKQGGIRDSGGRFRHLLAAVFAAAKREDLDSATTLADSAASLAVEQGWPALAATAQLALAGVLAKGRRDEALTRCGQAEAQAEKAQEAGDGQGAVVRLRARLMKGSLLLEGGVFGEAASWYEATVPIAQAANDALSTIECWRLASYSHEGNGAYALALKAGRAGLDVGEKLEPEQKDSSTLPYLAKAMARLRRQRGQALGTHAGAEVTGS